MSNAKVAQEFLTEWNPGHTGDMLSEANTVSRASLSINYLTVWRKIIGKQGSDGGSGLELKSALIAIMRHRKTLPILGILTKCKELLARSVLIHFLSKWAPGGAKVTSFLRKCFECENCLSEGLY